MWNDLQLTSKLLEKQKKIFTEDEKLFKREVITEYQYASSQQSYLSMESQFSNQINNFKIQIFSTIENLVQQRDLVVSQHKDIKSQLDQTLINDENIIINDKLVLIKSKYPGIIADIAVNSYELINRGMNVLTIIRSDLPKYGVLYIMDENIGKIKTGQKVNIKFDAFPFQEYGVQSGVIVSISTDPKIIDGAGLAYEARMAFDNINPKIKLKYGMHGLADIETGEKKLIETIFAPISKIFDYINGKNDNSI
jgi:multidrug resistance efflux pump